MKHPHWKGERRCYRAGGRRVASRRKQTTREQREREREHQVCVRVPWLPGWLFTSVSPFQFFVLQLSAAPVGQSATSAHLTYTDRLSLLHRSALSASDQLELIEWRANYHGRLTTRDNSSSTQLNSPHCGSIITSSRLLLLGAAVLAVLAVD